MGVTQSTQHNYVQETSKGRLQGIESRDKSDKAIMRRFTKIPYAEPPVGQLRWRRPQPLPSSFSFDQDGKAGDYTKFGPICPQPVYNIDAVFVDNPDAAPRIENVHSEDCLYLNMWVPVEPPPEKGWPVQFYIHGGWLQMGNAMQANDNDPFDLLAHSTPRIIVSPTYRLNLFGFAAGADLASAIPDAFAGNFGLWDQRLALEWVYENISMFGGNPELITVSGLSAGAHSSLLQLYYDTHLPRERQIIKQAHLMSNSLAVQPNPTTSEILTIQFNSICQALDISLTLSAEEKLEKLRAVPWEELVATIPSLEYHTFRSSTDGNIADGGFIPPSFLTSLHDGTFATNLAERGTRIMLGEVRDEALLYKLINPPSNYDDLITQLRNYYPKEAVDVLVELPVYEVPKPDDQSVTPEQWADVFADIVADGQVHASIRGTTRCLLEPPAAEGIKAVSGENIFRYRICWRAKGLDAWLKPESKMCHGSDEPIWWACGFRAGFTQEDEKKCLDFLKPFDRFLQGEEDIGWGGAGNVDEALLLDEDGTIHNGWKDTDWKRCMTVWDAVWNAQKDVLSQSAK